MSRIETVKQVKGEFNRNVFYDERGMQFAVVDVVHHNDIYETDYHIYSHLLKNPNIRDKNGQDCFVTGSFRQMRRVVRALEKYSNRRHSFFGRILNFFFHSV